MKENKQVIIAIVAVAIIIATAFGGTYAYWTWVTAANQQTNVNFTVNQTVIEGMLYAKIEGNAGATEAPLKPTTCTTSSNAIIKTIPIKYFNSTVQAATVTATLKLTAFNLRSASYVPTSSNLGHLKYALTTSNTNCTTGVVQSGDLNDSGKTPSFSNGKLSSHVTLFSQTFTAPAEMSAEATQTYYLWIWLDSAYTHTNTGNTNSDPMQGFTISAQWSGQIAQNNS